MFNVWHNVNPERIKKDDFLAVIEIRKGGRNKYELDKETGMIILDRVLYTSTLVLCQEVIDPLVLVRCYPIGVLKMIDGGKVDEKIIAIPFSDPTYAAYKELGELPEHMSRERSHFFEVYKMLENKETSVNEILGREEAEKIIEESIKSYKEKILG